MTSGTSVFADEEIRWKRVAIAAVLLEVALFLVLLPIGIAFGEPFIPESSKNGDYTIFFTAVPTGCFVFGYIAGMPLVYTDHVRRALAATLLLLAATLPIIDTVSCPDGCTEPRHEFIDGSSYTGSPGAACLFCVGGYGIARAATILIAADSVSPLAVPPSPHIISNTSPSLDRPPRV